MTYFILVLLGIIFGSFVCALVGRLKANKDWVKDRSACDHCGHQLAARDLVPVISWLLLRGRCRYCRKPISFQNPAVELAMAILFVVSYAFWPYGFNGVMQLTQFGLWLALVTTSVGLAVYDLRWMILPNNLVQAATRLAAASWLISLHNANYSSKFIVSTLLSLVIASGLFYLIFQVSKGEWIGGGDVKFGIVYGLLLADPLKSLLVIFLASFLGSIISIPILVFQRSTKQTKIPFGPFLILAMFITNLWGNTIIAWYQNLFYL